MLWLKAISLSRFPDIAFGKIHGNSGFYQKLQDLFMKLLANQRSVTSILRAILSTNVPTNLRSGMRMLRSIQAYSLFCSKDYVCDICRFISRRRKGKLAYSLFY